MHSTVYGTIGFILFLVGLVIGNTINLDHTQEEFDRKKRTSFILSLIGLILLAIALYQQLVLGYY
jgi:hypothetical protein